jgi:simple sugar transport system substrate-binding protein
MKRTAYLHLLLASPLLMAALAMAQTNSTNPNKSADIVTVVKATSLPWFKRMGEGVLAFAKTPEAKGRTTGHTGPINAGASDQVKVVEEVLAEGKLKALALVPYDPPTIELTLKKAIDKGIKVVTHEAENQRYTHADIEAFDNLAFGARLNERMAQCMKGEGKWTVFVGSIGSRTHMDWAGGGIDNAAKLHPKMQLVDAKQESAESPDQAYLRAKDILKKYPDIKGFQGSAGADILGIARAVQEAGVQDKICVFGTGLPSVTRKWIESGAIDGISLWDSKDAGLAMNRVATMLLDNQPITNGVDLGIPGYRKVTVRKGPGIGVVITGEAWVDVDRNNIKDYPF